MASKIAQLGNVMAFTTQVQEMIKAPIGQERMACFYGPSGWGKTTAVSAAQIIYNVIAIEVIENTSKLDVLDQITTQLQLKCRRDVASRIRAVAQYMERTERPLVIDDAQYLIKRGMIGIARDIYNTAGGLVPVILVGEEKLPQSLTGFENIHNRIANWTGAEPCSVKDGEKLAKIYAADVEVSEDLLNEIVMRADGSIRRVSTMLGAAREIAQSRGTNKVTLADWGTRPFFDGQPPIERKPAQLKPNAELVAPTKLRKVGRA